jgi:hypothetical protein
MSKHIPGIQKRGLLHKKWVAESLSAGPPVVAAGGGAVTAAAANNSALVGALSFGVVWLIGSSIWKVLHARAQDQSAEQNSSHDGLVGALHVLHMSVAHTCGIRLDQGEDLRVTIHRVMPPLDAAETIEQIVPYVGGGGGGAGRCFSVRSGITGMAIRQRKPVAAARVSNDEAAYREELKSDWGYTEKDSRALRADRRSFMALPIRGKDDVQGVVYLDSNKPNAFAEGTTVASLIVAACSGLNEYCNARYGQ